jgi:type IV secretion system protein VirB6
MADFCAPIHDLGMIRDLLSSVDCNVRFVTESGYRSVSGPNSQLAFALTALMTIYVAVFGFRLLLGMTPLRIGDLTMRAIKIGVVLALATSWPTYQQVVFDALFQGPEQLAASMMTAIQPSDSLLRGNPFDGLQFAFSQMQAAAAFLTHISPPLASPLAGGVPFAAVSLNLASLLTVFTTVGLILTAKIVLGLLLALGPLFVAFLLFDGTRGIFEGWLRATLGFAFLPLFATLALVVQLTLLAPHLLALAQMVSSGQPDLPAAMAVLILTLVAAMVSLAGVVGLFIVAAGFKLPAVSLSPDRRSEVAPVVLNAGIPATLQSFEPRIVSVGAAAAALDRRDMRLEAGETPRRLSLGTGTEPVHRAASHGHYRRSAQLHRSASSARRDR